jgi:hypothetical protein
MMTKTFNLSGSVERLFERWPGVVQLFIQNHMACPGCYLAGFESLEGALQIYQIEQGPFLNDLQKIISNHACSESQDNHQESPNTKGASYA